MRWCIFRYNKTVKLYLPLAWWGVIGLALVVLINTLAYRFAWYWRFGWLDLAMHAVGGLTVALLLFGLTSLSTKGPNEALFYVLAAVMLVGILWEIVQYGSFLVGWHSFNALQLGWSDTVGDLTSDLLGGGLGWRLSRHFNHGANS